MAQLTFALPKPDYTLQYSLMYRSRTETLGALIEKHMKEEGCTRVYSPKEGKAFLIGCVVVSAKKPQIIKDMDSVKKIEDPEWRVEHPEYFLEDARMERIKLRVSEDQQAQLVNGCVAGVLGTKDAHGFKVERIVLPLEAFSSISSSTPSISSLSPSSSSTVASPHKKQKRDSEASVDPACEQLFVIPNAESPFSFCQIEKCLGGAEKKESSAVVFYEGVLHSCASEAISKLSSSRVLLVPGATDRVGYMVPFQAPSRFQLGLPESSCVLTNPAVVTCSGQSVLFCNALSVREVMRYLGTVGSTCADKYVEALSFLVQAMHISPCSPDTCPTYPMEEDLFVLKSIPEIFVLSADTVNSVIKHVVFGSISVALVVLSTQTREVLSISARTLSFRTIY
ncbi:DNA polymerase delta subunit 2 [Nematocida sp. AWRm77]|nr:DNA polymerase delta subunit 2 [Nematocida sp. AWRm77]